MKKLKKLRKGLDLRQQVVYTLPCRSLGRSRPFGIHAMKRTATYTAMGMTTSVAINGFVHPIMGDTTLA